RVAVVEGADVAVVGPQVIGLEHRDECSRAHQGDEHQQHHDADALEFLVHAASAGDHCSTTSRGWCLIESDRRRRRATMIQLATSEEPPAARNGVVSPVSGMTRVTPPMTMKTCSATTKLSPTPSRRPKSSCPENPIRRPRETKIR